MLCKPSGRSIFVNSSSPDFEQIILETAAGILAHEYGHIRFRTQDSGFFNADLVKSIEEELFADKFAGHLLGLSKIQPESYIKFLKDNERFRDSTHPDVAVSATLVLEAFYETVKRPEMKQS